MSSAVAMNRKIAAQNQNLHSEEYVDRRQPQRQVARPRLSGTPVQQCWQVLNYHEQRLGAMDKFLVQHSRENAQGFEAHSKVLGIMDHKIKALEATIESLKALLVQNNASIGEPTTTSRKGSRSSKKGAVSLEVTED